MEQAYEYAEGPKGGAIKMWTRGVPVEAQAMEQLHNIADMPFIHKHVAVMPDVHFGMGATVGSVIATVGAVIPAAVGVDIGCGMIAQRTSLTASDLPESLAALRSEIERVVPHGRTNNGRPGDRGAWTNVPVAQEDAYSCMYGLLRPITDKYPDIDRAAKNAHHHLGTLGGGNHFVEICLDTEDRVWVMLHSGSRGVGNKIGTTFIELAQKDMERWFIQLPDKDLAYIPEGSDLFKDYVLAVEWAQNFALTSREFMMVATLKALGQAVGKRFTCDQEAVNCHHNYVSREKHFGTDGVIVTRKGAVSAREGELGIIPGSMGAKSFIVRGKGNHESFHSCSHGAGRVMSRNEAKKRFTVEDQIHATEGIECRKDESVIDEIPMAYKNIDDVMAAQSDLVEIVHTLRQVLCVKG